MFLIEENAKNHSNCNKKGHKNISQLLNTTEKKKKKKKTSKTKKTISQEWK